AHLDTVHDFAANAALIDDVGQSGVLSADRCGELSSRCSPFGWKWTQRRTASSSSIGAPNSRHSGMDRLALFQSEMILPRRGGRSTGRGGFGGGLGGRAGGEGGGGRVFGRGGRAARRRARAFRRCAWRFLHVLRRSKGARRFPNRPGPPPKPKPPPPQAP